MKEKPPMINAGQIGEIVGSCKQWWEIPALVVQAQRDADIAWCEQAQAEVAREIFEEIGKSASHLQEPVEVAFYFYKKDWQSLKDKWLKGSNENQTS